MSRPGWAACSKARGCDAAAARYRGAADGHSRPAAGARTLAPVLAGAWLLTVTLSVPAWAVDVPDAGSQQSLERQQRERQRQEQRLERVPEAPPVAVPAAPPARAASTDRNIPVTRIETGPSSILSDDELRAAVAPFEGRAVSLAELVEATETINRLYAQRGAPTARALLPPQDVDGGVVRITLVEARLGDVRLGPGRLDEAYVLPRLGLATGELVSVPRIEAALQRFNRVNDVQLSATLAAGAATGTTDLALRPTDPPRVLGLVLADNAGTDSLGEGRVGVSLRLPVLSARGDALSANLLATGSAPSLSGTLGYQLPIGPTRRLELGWSQGRIEVRQGPFAELGVTGTSRELGAAVQQVLRIEPEGVWTAQLRLAAKESTSRVAGALQQDTRLNVLTLATALDWQDAGGTWTADAALSGGLKGGGGDAAFSVLRVNVARLQRLAGGDQLLLRGALQASPDAGLPSAEQFQLGGSATVRGYTEGLLSARQALLATLEWRRPLALGGNLPGAVLLAVHADAGAAWSGRRQAENVLASAGVGVLADVGPFGLRAHLAWPLRNTALGPDPKQPRLHLATSLSW